MLRYKVLFFKKKLEELAQIEPKDEDDTKGRAIMVRSIEKRLDCLTEVLDVVLPDEGLEIISSATTGVQGAHSELESGISTTALSTEHVGNYPLPGF